MAKLYSAYYTILQIYLFMVFMRCQKYSICPDPQKGQTGMRQAVIIIIKCIMCTKWFRSVELFYIILHTLQYIHVCIDILDRSTTIYIVYAFFSGKHANWIF